VDYVTAFSLVHFYSEKNPRNGQVMARITDTALEEVPFIRASVPEGVLIPSDEHLITVLEASMYEDPKALGIDGLLVSNELLVGKEADTGPPQQDDRTPFDEEMLTISIQPK
jgi:hypothetical protein